MRIRWAKIIAEIGLVLLGTALLIIAIFAYQLHLDNNQSTGPNRIALAILGALFLLIAILINSHSFFSRLLNLPVNNKIKPFLAWILIPYLWLNESCQEISESTKSNRRTGWFAVAGALIAIFVSLWYITSGKIVTWVPSKAFYDRQANAFLSGQLSLLEEPPAGLATLANPYQFQNRNGIDYLWDVSYYKGKY